MATLTPNPPKKAPPASLRVQQYRLNSPVGRALITELDVELSAMYAEYLPDGYRGSPTPDATGEDEDENNTRPRTPDDVTFFVAFPASSGGLKGASTDAKDAVGCTAILHRPGLVPFAKDLKIGELKRMYVRPEYRGSGAAEALMRGIEVQARDVLGMDMLVLTTGTRQVAAIRLYERCGWLRGKIYGKTLEAVDEQTVFAVKSGLLVPMEKWLKP